MGEISTEQLKRQNIHRYEKAVNGVLANTKYYLYDTGMEGVKGRYVIAPTAPNDHYGGIVFGHDPEFSLRVIAALSNQIHHIRVCTDNTFVVLDGMNPETGEYSNMRYLQKGQSGNIGIAIQRLNYPAGSDRSPYTQPPLFASGTKLTYLVLMDKDRFSKDQTQALLAEGDKFTEYYSDPKKYLQEIYPRLQKAYDYFTNPKYLMGADGLIRLNTPHATGMDSTPAYFKAKMRLLQKNLKDRFPKMNFNFLTSKAFLEQRLMTEDQRKIYEFIATDIAGLLNLDHQHMNAGWELGKTLETFSIEDISLNCQVANNLRDMAFIAREIKHPEEANHYLMQADELEERIIEKMWDEKKGLFYNLAQGEMTDVATISSLFPITLQSMAKPQHRGKLKALLAKMNDSQFFKSEYPWPSVARNEPLYDPDYRTKGRIWLGPTWLNTSYLLMEGLQQLMEELKDSDNELAIQCKEMAIDAGIRIGDIVDKYGAAEFYHPDSGLPQRQVVKGEDGELKGKGFTWSYLGHLMYYRAKYLQKDRKEGNFQQIDEHNFYEFVRDADF